MRASKTGRRGRPEGASYLVTFAKLEEYLAAFANGHLQNCGITFVEPRQHLRARELIGFDAAMLPKMDFGEIVETRIIERRKKRILKIDLLKHGIAAL